MSSQPDLAAYFRAMEALVEAQPEGVNAEIAHGVYLMSPRPGPRHSSAQGRLFSLLDEKVGRAKGSAPPDWLFLIEPEIRSAAALSRLIPDVAGWRRSTSGWPDLDESPISLVPEWVGESLSGSTEQFDRGPKKEAYGLMGVGWLWLLDARKRTVECFENIRGKMVPGPNFGPGETLCLPPFPAIEILMEHLFLP